MANNGYVTVEIKGLDELQHKLEQLPFKMAKRYLRKALIAGAMIFKNAMVALAPKDTNFLAEHFGIRTSMRNDAIAGTAYIGPQGKIDYPMYASGAYNVKRSKGGRIRLIGRIAVATVARFIEFGTSKMAGKPFMTQAFETQKENALNAVIDSLKDSLQ